MSPRPLLGFLLLAASTAAHAQDKGAPALAGYATRIGSPTDFDVNGIQILLGPNTKFQTTSKVGSKVEFSPATVDDLALYLGEPIDIYGEAPRKTHTVAATRIVLSPREPHPVNGEAIIDAVLPLPAGASPTDRLVRADGYPILLTAKTVLVFDKPLTTAADIHVNVWILFHGSQRPDGIVVADDASFGKNLITHGEDMLRESNEYDPAAVASDKKQSALSKGFRGIDPKQIPPYKDEAMQARVSAIGAKLVPKYQFDFPYTEETRIDFRFQVIDSTRWRDAVTLPNGIILVPRQVVERMQNDSQLATVLADNIACALEKQPLRGNAQGKELTAANLAGDAGSLLVPGLGIATSIATYAVAKRIIRLSEEQSGRVSLSLLHDAGYDLDQAPIAWWLLAPKKPEDIKDITLPYRAAYLYQFRGQTWPPN